MSLVILCPWVRSSKSESHALVEEFIKKISYVIPTQIRSCDNNQQKVDDFYRKELNKVQKKKPLIVALDPCGKTMSSEKFAQMLETEMVNAARSKEIWFCIGDAHGLPSVFSKSDVTLTVSLSPFTLSHEIALLVTLEQIYRALMILKNHPYHHAAPSAFARDQQKPR